MLLFGNAVASYKVGHSLVKNPKELTALKITYLVFNAMSLPLLSHAGIGGVTPRSAEKQGFINYRTCGAVLQLYPVCVAKD